MTRILGTDALFLPNRKSKGYFGAVGLLSGRVLRSFEINFNYFGF